MPLLLLLLPPPASPPPPLSFAPSALAVTAARLLLRRSPSLGPRPAPPLPPSLSAAAASSAPLRDAYAPSAAACLFRKGPSSGTGVGGSGTRYASSDRWLALLPPTTRLSRVGHLPAASEASRLPPSREGSSSGSMKLRSGAMA